MRIKKIMMMILKNYLRKKKNKNLKKDKSIHKKPKNEENIVGFKLGSKDNEEKEKNKKTNNCC